MSFYVFFAYIVALAITHNVINGIRLRWRVMLRSPVKAFVLRADRATAICVGVLPAVAIALWSWFSFVSLSKDGNLPFAIIAWLATAGVGITIVCRDVFRALTTYVELRASYLGSTVGRAE